LADCDSSGNISPDEIIKKITPKTKAVIITHMWGIPCDMDRIVKICKEHNLLLFEDISHAFGAMYKGKKVGTFGDAAACSLQAQKVLTGGEGGFFITNNNEMFYRALLLGHYNKRCKNEIPESSELRKYSLTGMGLKLRIHPLAAAIALEQFDKVDKILINRNNFARQIYDELQTFKEIEILMPSKDESSSWYALIIKYRGKQPIQEFYNKLHEKGLVEMDMPGSTVPLHLLPLFQSPEYLFPDYKGKLNYKKGDFPNSEKFASGIIKMPVWSMKKEKKYVDKYIRGIREVIQSDF
jgi:dTDP-4-amino-4,6-dideoxygalactose transaminase